MSIFRGRVWMYEVFVGLSAEEAMEFAADDHKVGAFADSMVMQILNVFADNFMLRSNNFDERRFE